MSATIEPRVSGSDEKHPVGDLGPPIPECLTVILKCLNTMKVGGFRLRVPASWTRRPGRDGGLFQQGWQAWWHGSGARRCTVIGQNPASRRLAIIV